MVSSPRVHRVLVSESVELFHVIVQALFAGTELDAITIGVTVSYVLSYNERHPEKPLLNGATFGCP